MAQHNKQIKWVLRLAALSICAVAGLSYAGLRSIYTNNSFDPLAAAYAQDKANKVIAPQDLYRKAWGLIKDSYYDQKFGATFGGQSWQRWEHKYDGKLKTQEDSHKAIDSMLASLGDPYTRFLNEENFSDEKQQIQAKLFGVGMQLGMNKEHKVVVIAPIDNTPASKAGIHSGDEIIEVDSKPVKGQSLDQVVKQIRGEKNTKVNITLLRGTNRSVVELVRAEIPIKSVVSCQTLPGDIGYIRLDSFISQKANEEMREALHKLDGSKGLILDLRNNPGGLLANAIDIANMFLDRGVIVSTIDADGYKTSQLATRSSFKTELPVVLLINKGSASASEILSGALRDNGRAKLIGQTTFGKGLVQAINPLGNGTGVNVTIAKYLTPNDTDIHKTGIVPDFEVKLNDDDLSSGKGPWWFDPTMTNFKRSPADGKDIQLVKAIEVIKQQINGAGPVASSTESSKESSK